MNFDSFVVIDDNGHKRKINFNTRSVSSSKSKKLKKPRKPVFIIGEVGSGMNFQLKSQMVHNMLHSGRSINTTFHASNTSAELMEEMKDLFGITVPKYTKSQRLARNRAMKYRSKRLTKVKVKSHEISPSTIRRLKKYLSVYGKFSFKSEIYIFDELRMTFQASNDSIFKHLYFMDSTSGLCINVADYIAINMMGCGYERMLNGDKVMLVEDYICGYEIAIVKGNYNKFYLTERISI